MLTKLSAKAEAPSSKPAALPALSWTQKAVLLAVYFVIVFARAPFLLTQGRFWAEEGCVYFQYAWTTPAWHAILAPHLGYYAFFPNFCAVLAAHFFPIVYAPLMVTWCALLVQMLAAYLVLDCEAFVDLNHRILALAVLLFTAPNKEVWLNTINSQFYFLVCGMLIFLSAPDRRPVFRNAVLLIAGLTGILTVYLTPFFWIRAWRDRRNKSRGAVIQAAVLTVCMAVQFYVVLQFLHSGERQIHFQWQDIGPALLTRDMAMPLAGRPIATHLAFIMRQHLAPAFLVLWSGVAIGALAAFCFLVGKERKGESVLLVVAAVWTSCLCMYGAINTTTELIYPSVSERYSFGSNIMLAMSLVLTTQGLGADKAAWRRVAGVLLVAVFAMGIWDYGTYMRWLMPEARPAWRLQIAEWDKDPSYRLQAWPNREATKFTLPHKQ